MDWLMEREGGRVGGLWSEVKDSGGGRVEWIGE